ncbi:hypothetical protein DNTS_022135 [Danionella cerebrum]|uniref:VLIG-type G domain-containing protein n=1 Tax=Danionella cerebrum TaxID=2873325 RepID=A0A553R0N1_9TELE|nr:hypothetical protein DNTS_022135 [Danionella translucida]
MKVPSLMEERDGGDGLIVSCVKPSSEIIRDGVNTDCFTFSSVSMQRPKKDNFKGRGGGVGVPSRTGEMEAADLCEESSNSEEMESYQHHVFFTAPELSNEALKSIEKYFKLKKKSGGGDCEISKVSDDVYKISFVKKKARERVLQQKDHTIALSGEKNIYVSLGSEPGNHEHMGANCAEKVIKLDQYLLRYIMDYKRAKEHLKKLVSGIYSTFEIRIETAELMVTRNPGSEDVCPLPDWELGLHTLIKTLDFKYKIHFESDPHKCESIQKNSFLQRESVKFYFDTAVAVVVGEVNEVEDVLRSISRNQEKPQVQKRLHISQKTFLLIKDQFESHAKTNSPSVQISEEQAGVLLVKGPEKEVSDAAEKLLNLTQGLQEKRIPLHQEIMSFLDSSGAVQSFQERFQENLQQPVLLETTDRELLLLSLSDPALREAAATIDKDLCLKTVSLENTYKLFRLNLLREFLGESVKNINAEAIKVEIRFQDRSTWNPKVQLVGFRKEVDQLENILRLLPPHWPETTERFSQTLSRAGLKNITVEINTTSSSFPCIHLKGPRREIQGLKHELGSFLQSLITRRFEIQVSEDAGDSQSDHSKEVVTGSLPEDEDLIHLVFAVGGLEQLQADVFVAPMVDSNLTSTSTGLALLKKAGQQLQTNFNDAISNDALEPGEVLEVDATPALRCKKVFFMESGQKGNEQNTKTALHSGLGQVFAQCEKNSCGSVALPVMELGSVMVKDFVDLLTQEIGKVLSKSTSSLQTIYIVLMPAKQRKETEKENSAREQTNQEEETKLLFNRLGLVQNSKLTTADVLELSPHSLQSHERCTEEELVETFLQKLLMMNYRVRQLKVKDTDEPGFIKQSDTDSSEDDSDSDISEPSEETHESEGIHPMDVQMAVFHCADAFLKQLMVTKLSQCQYALPLLVPDPFTQKTEFHLWTFRQIHKSWKIRNNSNETIIQTHPICKAETPMVFFFRFGEVSSSKSELMNHLINEKHNTFFHRNCPGSTRTRELMEGVVEITWYCPSGKPADKFNDFVAFCNLHGDAGEHEEQLRILSEMASVNVVLLPKRCRNDKSAAMIQDLHKNKKKIVCLLTEETCKLTQRKKGEYKIGLKDRNHSDVSEELIKTINLCLSESPSTFRLEDVFRSSPEAVDEEDCKRGREAGEKMIGLLKDKDLIEIKESFLPHQGKLWHQWSQKNKELHRPQGENLEEESSLKTRELREIRLKQHKHKISAFIKLFIQEMMTQKKDEIRFFLNWLRILLDEYTSGDLSVLHQLYDKTWSDCIKLKNCPDESEHVKAKTAELEKISEKLLEATFGVEHIMREIGQIFECCSSVKKTPEDLPVPFSDLPSLAAEMMISGFPLELMDGDAAHVPLLWISAVLEKLNQKLGDQTRVFVLSVLGLQSSGKSTMLNAMFGLQFAVSAGRCTRGAFMQLVKVSAEMKTEQNLKFDYILVVDTEGLRSQELAGKLSRHHDNKLATFIVGVGNLTLINIFGENPSEMQEILQIVVQAFLRMKKVNLKPSCVFVHQNVSDVTAGEKNMEGRRRLQETLNEMTKLAAKEEDCSAESFSDVIGFDVQRDMKYFAQLWEGSPPMAPPNPSYCENIQELKESIISHTSHSQPLRLMDLKQRVTDIWEALLNERFVFSFRNSLEISAYRKLETEYGKCSWTLRRSMMETENKLHNQIENETISEVQKLTLQQELKATSEDVKKSLTAFFEKDTDKEILVQWKSSFEIRLVELQENLVRKTEKKLNEILQQRELRKKIDSLKTNHENALYEKSKELALKLKDNATDEKTLKKEFDSFWDQSVKKIVSESPRIKDINIMRDAQDIITEANAGVATDSLMESGEYRYISALRSYIDYVKIKKSSGVKGTLEGGLRTVGKALGYCPLSKEEEAQIQSFIVDVALETENMIRSFNISKMGYNTSYVQEIIGYIKARITQHEENHQRYEFKNIFFINLVLFICVRVNKTITDQQRLFREANDPIIYLENKREEYYSIFQKYCQGATSTAIFGEFLCQKLKDPIKQSIYSKTARDLADEIRSNHKSLNGNRSKLEKHILKILAEEENFNKYMNYIQTPRDHFQGFIRDEVNLYIEDKWKESALPKMEQHTDLLLQKIMKAADESTRQVQSNSGGVGHWIKSFTQQLSEELIFSEKDLTGVKQDDVDLTLLRDVIQDKRPALLDGISKVLPNAFVESLDVKFRPDALLIDHLCQCCWVQCPFCGVFCTNTIENHEGDHSVPFHKVDGIKGWHYINTEYLCAQFCTTVVSSDGHFFVRDERFPYKVYRKAGGVFAEWSITPDHSELPYWKWFVCRFQTQLEAYYKKTFSSYGKIPDEWRNSTKQDAIESLEKYFG